jgi:murein L,D-transpeptidase YcbB/YkuD
MSGVRLSGFLASTALALLLSASGTFAQSTAPSAGEPGVTAPDSAQAAPAPAAESDKANAALPAAGDSATPSPAPAASAAPTEPQAETPAAAASPPATPDSTQSSAQSPGQPENPAAASAPAAPAASAAPAEPAAAASPAQPGGQTETPAAEATPPAAMPDSTGSVDTAPANPATATMAPPASPAPTIDQQVADALQQLTTGKFDRVLGGKSERTAVDAFYSGRSYAPLWIADGHANARAQAAADYLAHVDADGLDPADYPVPDFNAITDPQALAEAELKFSATIITYAHHAAIGRVAWSRVSPDIEYDTKAPDPATVLAAMADARDVAAALDSYEPHAAGYLALKKKLAEIRAGAGDGLKPLIPGGPVLKIGEQDDRVAQVRKKLGLSDDGSNTYDKALAEAVKKFQKEHELKPTGTLTAATVDALNGPRPAHVIDTVIANMERWRWMPHDLGNPYVMINLPDFTAAVFNDGKRVWKTKIVIGKTDMPTPITTAMMKFITVNPVWHVPPSIINREYLPAMAQDPTVMQRMGLVVEHDGSGRVTGIYQPPGDNNAEGRLRFNFPNKFLVYQHDTPDKYMFGYARRAFSHGCMRTQDPVKYAEVLLSLVRPNDGYTEERIRKMFGPQEINIDFPKFIPIHITYQTAFVDSEGKLQFRDDIYGRDKALLAILHNPQEMRVADIPVERHIDAVHREILSVPDSPSLFGGPSTGSGPEGFFARLFGGFSQPQPVARPPVRRRVSRSYRTRTSTVAR